MAVSLTVQAVSWPIQGTFAISRGSKTTAETVVATLSDGGHQGQGACVPYARYGETVEGVMAQLNGLAPEIIELDKGLTRQRLQTRLPAGAARNALDCAFWDLEAKRAGVRVWQLPEIRDLQGSTQLDEPTASMAPTDLISAYTLSLDTPQAMGEKAREVAHLPLLKVKLAGPDDLERMISTIQCPSKPPCGGCQ